MASTKKLGTRYVSGPITWWIAAAFPTADATLLPFAAPRAASGTVFAYTYTGSTITVNLAAGEYDITAYGAQGGSGQGTSGGHGAEMEAQFSFTQSTSLTLLVGGAGSGVGGGGGGGGSFVVVMGVHLCSWLVAAVEVASMVSPATTAKPQHLAVPAPRTAAYM
jgi:hypothetical protein